MRKKKQEWNEQMIYESFITELQQEGKKYEGDNHGSSVDYPNSTDSHDGYWSIEDFRNTDKIQNILGFGRNALHAYYIENNYTAWSAYNDHFAANLDKIVNELHRPDKKDEKTIETTFVDEGGHGTVIVNVKPDTELNTEYTHLDGETHGEYNWWFVDTTSDWALPINNPEIKIGSGARGEYNPFIQGYQGTEQTSSFSYKTEKLKAKTPLLGFVHRDKQKHLGYDPQHISFSDPVLETIFNEHVPEDGSAEPIIDMAEKAIDLQIDTEEYIQVYGDELEYNEEDEIFEGLKYAVGDEELHEVSRDPYTRLVETEVESMLEPDTA